MSETLQSIAEELPSTEITAFDIARAIAGRHPEYASGRLHGMTLDAPVNTVSHEWELWRDSIARLFDRAALARSRYKVIDGRLFLAGLGLIDKPLRDALDKRGDWAPLLLEVDEAVAPTGSQLRSFLQAVQFAHGYQSDQASGQDQLDIQGEVNAVCEVITDPEVKPPLAVGLFGAWGAGKSFFMEKMRERIDELTTGSTPRPNLRVVQIRFNAWHYADTSLWASLAVEIFERLVDPEPVGATARAKWLSERGDPKRAERERLLAELETYRAAKVALDGERARLEAERHAVEARLEEASRQRRDTVANFTLTDVAGELAKDPRMQKAIRGITDTLGLTPAVEELTGLGTELRTSAGYLPAVWRLVRHKTWTVMLAAAFVVLTVITAALTVRGGSAWLGSLVTAAASVGSAVLAAAKLLRPAAQQVNAALAAVESAITTASTIEADLRLKRSREERELELRLAEIDREIDEATRAVAALDEQSPPPRPPPRRSRWATAVRLPRRPGRRLPKAPRCRRHAPPRLPVPGRSAAGVSGQPRQGVWPAGNQPGDSLRGRPRPVSAGEGLGGT